MTTSTKSELRPLSQRDNMLAFVSELKYPPGPSAAAQFYLDHELIGKIGEALRLSFPVDGRPPTVADLGEKLNQVVADFETVHYREWTGPEPGPDIAGRLDAWFEPHQERHAAYRREQEGRATRYREDAGRLDAEVAARADQQFRGVWGLPRAT